jgi:hypothetical protein
MDLNHYYTSRADSLSAQISAFKARARYFIAGEISSFLLGVAFIVAYFAVDYSKMMLFLAAVSIAVYAVIRFFDVKSSLRLAEAYALKSVYEDELHYLSGDYSIFKDGEKYVDAHHDFTFDLDIFGPDSLFQRINRTVTSGGSDRLASLLGSDLGNVDDAKDIVEKRRKAVTELSDMEPWRAKFRAAGKSSGGLIDTNAITKTLKDIDSLNISRFAASRTALILASIVIGGFWVTLILSIFGSISGMVPLWWAVWQFFGVLLLCAGTIKKISRATDALLAQLKASIRLIRLIAEADFKEENNVMEKQSVADAVSSFDELGKILSGLDRRANLLGLMFFNILYLSDFFLIRRFLRWQGLYINKVEQWMNSMGDIDARISMANMAFNHPETSEAEIIESDKIVYEARNLYHPFIGPLAVKNDFSIADRNYYIITGANMAGKSTFLRAVGVNYVLAINGMPVFAESLKISIFSLFSSMRTSDDLAHGISYFNAELLRLKQLLAKCRSARHTLIILDEILKGTNSLDKLNGSRLFLTSVARLPVSGVIATHDLELSRMADDDPSRFHNYCFEIELGNKVTYSYKITPDIARNQNATYLLKEIIKDIN